MSYEKIFDLVTKVDDFVWGPAMLVLLVGTGYFSDHPCWFPYMEKSRIRHQKYTE